MQTALAHIRHGEVPEAREHELGVVPHHAVNVLQTCGLGLLEGVVENVLLDIEIAVQAPVVVEGLHDGLLEDAVGPEAAHATVACGEGVCISCCALGIHVGGMVVEGGGLVELDGCNLQDLRADFGSEEVAFMGVVKEQNHVALCSAKMIAQAC